MCVIVKRDGRKVPFNKQKIQLAVIKCFDNTPNCNLSTGEILKVADDISNEIDATKDTLTVEKIQNRVVESLREKGFDDIADQYNSYREERTLIRERNSSLMVEIGEKLTASNVQNQNANVDEHSFGGRKGEADSSLMKYYALNYIMSDKSRYNHINNRIYIHDLDSYAVGMHNCFQRNTSFITNYGILTFENFKDGDKIQVLDKDGCWRDATVRYYGRQPMQKVTLERSGKIKTVDCTKDHRWILKDGSVTTNLSIGDRLYPLANITDFQIESPRDAEMFCFGLILADGTDAYSNDNDQYIKIRLCGDKTQYAPLFESSLYKEHNSSENTSDKFYCKKVSVGKQSFLTNKMWNLLTMRDKVALFNGYYAGDGSKTTSTPQVSTADERIVEMINDISALAGYHVFNIKEIVGDTNYKKNRTLFNITLTKSISDSSLWKVIDIKRQPNKDYEAWCIEEPVTHSFTLADGVVTGNCLSFPFDKVLASGFNTRQTDVRPANSVNTAFQLVAVLFQLQSLQQFGGVSATHLDWTMVPYVRKSFMKHYISAYIMDSEDFYNLNIMDILFETYEDEVGVVRSVFDDWVDDHKNKFFVETGLKEEDFRFDNKDNLDCKLYSKALYETVLETQQAAEGMYHNLNTLQSRSGNQLPFTSVNYGTCTSMEGRLVIKSLLMGSIKGVGKHHKTPIFPCGIFQCMKGVNRKPGDPNYDMYELALKSTSRRLYPNYANVDWSGNAGYDINDPNTYFSTMGKRKLQPM